MLTVDPFEMPVQVAEGDLDQLGHVNNIVYVRWVQDVAVAHWQSAATPEEQARVAWVVLRHEIDYHAPALLGDTLNIRTWVGKASGLRFERHTAVIRPSDGKTLARALTLWCPIDPATGRPCRVPECVRLRFAVAGE